MEDEDEEGARAGTLRPFLYCFISYAFAIDWKREFSFAGRRRFSAAASGLDAVLDDIPPLAEWRAMNRRIRGTNCFGFGGILA